MTISRLGSEKKIVALDSQRLEALESCMYQYKLMFGTDKLYGIAPLIAPDYYERGGLIHVMLDTYYKLRNHRTRWRQNRATHMSVVQSCINVGRYKAVKMDLDIADVEICIDAFKQYTDYWENDGWDIIHGVEQTGSRVLYEDDELIILYEVKIDLIIGLTNAIVPIDHKTAKSHREPNQMSNQFKGYCWFLGVNNLIVNEIGFQKTLKPEAKFQRHMLSYPQALIDEWREETIWWVKNHALPLIEAGMYPRNPTSCNKFSGCPFKEICLADPLNRDYKINSRFKPRNWDVGEENL